MNKDDLLDLPDLPERSEGVCPVCGTPLDFSGVCAYCELNPPSKAEREAKLRLARHRRRSRFLLKSRF